MLAIHPNARTTPQRAFVCPLRRATGFPLDDLTFIVNHFLPHETHLTILFSPPHCCEVLVLR